jgi:hypothetical protein
MEEIKMAKKQKKMTAKEFEEVFTNLYGNFEIWGYEGILNCMACLARYDADDLARHNCPHAAASNQKKHDDIVQYLTVRGYYADCE